MIIMKDPNAFYSLDFFFFNTVRTVITFLIDSYNGVGGFERTSRLKAPNLSYDALGFVTVITSSHHFCLAN